MEIENGSIIIGYWKEAPIKLNWTIILSALFFSRFEFLPAFWVTYFGLIFIHEAGHVLIVRHYKLWVDEILIHGFGGHCRWGGDVSEFERSIIAWGGILAQLSVFIVAIVLSVILGPPKSSFSSQIYHVCIETNLLIMFFNLIPVEPLDGSRAWKILNPFRDFISTKSKEFKYKRQDRKLQKQMESIMNAKVEIDSKENNFK